MGFVAIIFDTLLVILSVIQWIVAVWVIISWLVFFAANSSFRRNNRGAYNVLEQLNDICGRMAWPFVSPIRRVLRRFNTAGIDWSPMVLFILIYILQRLIGELERVILLPGAGRG
jgi:uncharacterized protein YggT (Ycf19 family)